MRLFVFDFLYIFSNSLDFCILCQLKENLLSASRYVVC